MRCPARLLAFVAALVLAGSGDAQTCTGKFANPITDICWSCILPISIGAAHVATLGQEDIENPASPLCVCPGVPTRDRDFDRLLGAGAAGRCDAQALLPGEPGRRQSQSRPAGARGRAMGAHDRTLRPARFYQAHWYANPMLYWLEVLLDFGCLESGWLRPRLPDRGRSAVEGRRAHHHPQSGRDSLRQPDRACRLRGRLRGGDASASAFRSSSGARAARAASIRSMATSPRTSAACRPRC